MTALVAWFTGLSGAGKTTIARLAAASLEARGKKVRVIDGDEIRGSDHRHLGFSPADIIANNRLIADLCRRCLKEYDVILVPIISPFRESREEAREVLGSGFLEVYVKASLETVRKRDPKGLYRRSAKGELAGVIGVSQDVPYEAPQSPALILDTETASPENCAAALVDHFCSQP